jgi:hypothetical protein
MIGKKVGNTCAINWSKFPITALLLVCLAFDRPALAADNEDVELIRFLAAQHKANKDQISTWKGKALVYDVVRWGDSNKNELKSSVVFALDTTQDLSRWNWTTEEQVIHEEGRLPWRLPKSINNGMIKDGGFYRFRIHDAGKEEPHHVLAIHDPTKEARSFLVNDFDPTWFLTNFGEEMSDRLMAIYGWATDPKEMPGFKYVLRREKSVITLELPWDRGINRYVFDLSKGGNLVSYYGQDSKVTEEWSYTYKQIVGIWVLDGLDHKNTQRFGNSNVIRTLTRRIEFVENYANLPLDDAEFSLDKLGVTPGDIVKDERAGLLYRYMSTGADEGLEDLLDLEMGATDLADPEEAPVGGNEAQNQMQSTETVKPRSDSNQPAEVEQSISNKPLAEKSTRYVVQIIGLFCLIVFVILIINKKKGIGSR